MRVPPLGRWRSLSEPVQDTALAALATALAFAPFLSDLGPEIGDLAAHGPAALDVVLPLALCLPLVVRRLRPELCLAVVAVAFGVTEALGRPHTFGTVAVFLALYAAGAHLRSPRALTATIATVGYVVLAVVLHHRGSPQSAGDYAVFWLFLAATWLAGAAVRRWRREDGERRALAAEVAVAGERARIARELHDVVTHHVTAMVVQAEATQYLVEGAPDRAAAGLDAISGTGRRALTELRSLLDVLEATGEGAGEPGRVADLVDVARLSGQPVSLSESGGARASVDAELAAYRIVQEALTNARRYAAGRATSVVVRREPGRLEVEVHTDSPEVAVSDPLSGGRGLSGLRERVRLLGGELVAGPGAAGGFTVHAELPSKETR